MTCIERCDAAAEGCAGPIPDVHAVHLKPASSRGT